jgi:hypothetical protein
MSSWDQANIGENLVWFGEIESKLAKLSVNRVLFLNYFMTIGLALFFLSRGSWLQLSMAVDLMYFPPLLPVVQTKITNPVPVLVLHTNREREKS